MDAPGHLPPVEAGDPGGQQALARRRHRHLALYENEAVERAQCGDGHEGGDDPADRRIDEGCEEECERRIRSG